VTSYRYCHHGDASCIVIVIATGYAAALCIEVAGQVEVRRAENRGRRPILWQRSTGQGASAC